MLCGLAGGKWEKIEPFIIEHIFNKDIDVYVYDYDCLFLGDSVYAYVCVFVGGGGWVEGALVPMLFYIRAGVESNNPFKAV